MADYENRALIGYLPDVLQEIREFKALMFAEQPEIFTLFAGIQTALDNEFVITATEYGVRRWEKILNITPDLVTDTLEIRKNRILLRLQTVLPFTEKWLEEMLDLLLDSGNWELDTAKFREYIFKLKFKNVSPDIISSARNFLAAILPANLSEEFGGIGAANLPTPIQIIGAVNISKRFKIQ